MLELDRIGLPALLMGLIPLRREKNKTKPLQIKQARVSVMEDTDVSRKKQEDFVLIYIACFSTSVPRRHTVPCSSIKLCFVSDKLSKKSNVQNSIFFSYVILTAAVTSFFFHALMLSLDFLFLLYEISTKFFGGSCHLIYIRHFNSDAVRNFL